MDDTDLRAELERVTVERDALRERLSGVEQLRAHLEWRGIEPGSECQRCSGSGVRTYASTATWRGGIGGQALTQGACDTCWGSGERARPWVDLRTLLDETAAARSQNAVRELIGREKRIGDASAQLELLADILDGVGSGRFAVSALAGRGFDAHGARAVARALARILREGSKS